MTLRNMGSQKAIWIAGPQGYGAAVAASGLYDLAKLPFSLMKGMGSFAKGEIWGRTVDFFARNLANYLYQQAAEE